MLALLEVGALAFAIGVHFGLGSAPVFREGLVVAERPLSLDPLVGADDPAVNDVGHLLYRSLLTLGARGYPARGLASSYAVSSDGLTYTVVLDGRDRWSDGRPITGADVVATVGFVESPRAIDPDGRTEFTAIRVAEAESVVTFTLAAPRASFAASLAELPILPFGGLSAAQLDSAASHPQRALATSGPYVVASANASVVALQPNPHARPTPAIRKYDLDLFLTFADAAASFRHGDIDSLLATSPAQRAQLLAVGGAHAADVTTFGFVDLLFNERVPGLADAAVRHAISVAVNRSAIVSGALRGAGGQVEVGPFSTGLRWLGLTLPEASSPAASSEALDGAGWVEAADGIRSKGGTPLTFTITVPAVDPLPVVAGELAKQLDAIGMRIRVDVIPPQVFITTGLVGREFQLAVAAWDPLPDPDISVYWRSNAVPPQGFNVSGGAADPFLDEALDGLSTTTDPAARQVAAAQVTTYLADDATAVFLYTPVDAFVFRTPMAADPIPALGGEAARYDDVASWRLT